MAPAGTRLPSSETSEARADHLLQEVPEMLPAALAASWGPAPDDALGLFCIPAAHSGLGWAVPGHICRWVLSRASGLRNSGQWQWLSTRQTVRTQGHWACLYSLHFGPIFSHFLRGFWETSFSHWRNHFLIKRVRSASVLCGWAPTSAALHLPWGIHSV